MTGQRQLANQKHRSLYCIQQLLVTVKDCSIKTQLTNSDLINNTSVSQLFQSGLYYKTIHFSINMSCFWLLCPFMPLLQRLITLDIFRCHCQLFQSLLALPQRINTNTIFSILDHFHSKEYANQMLVHRVVLLFNTVHIPKLSLIPLLIDIYS